MPSVSFLHSQRIPRWQVGMPTTRMKLELLDEQMYIAPYYTNSKSNTRSRKLKEAAGRGLGGSEREMFLFC